MLLNATLEANLDTLRVYVPKIYEKFVNFTPVDAGVVFNDEGNIDLYNKQQYIYRGAPEKFAQEQVDKFIKEPLFFNLELEKDCGGETLYDHQRVLKEITAKREKEVTSSPTLNEKRLDFVCMIGVGLGYQIEELVAQRQVQHLYLCEPSKDIFYAMLHCIELRPIFEHCIANGGSVTINTGNDYDDMLNGVNDVLIRIGRFYLPRFYVFKHYNSSTTDNFISQLKDIGYTLAFGWGFMEDEIIGFNHTLTNLKLGYKVCKKQSEFINSEPNLPVFIVANGPSLDFSLNFLKENKSDIIIISCGTTLRVLLKHNIKPDIHVEMERPVEMLPFIEEIEEQQKSSEIKLKNIQIVGLNTVYPELLKKFKTPLLLNKLNDAGGEFIEGLDISSVYTRPEHTNPTCPNAAAVLMIALGFKEIHFIGADFGYINNDYHHSKDSIYYDKDYKEPGLGKDVTEVIDNHLSLIDEQMNQELQRKGNFSDLVFSNQIFDSSRKQIEMLLSKHSNVNAYNCSDGVLIKHAKPTRIDDIELAVHKIDKESFLDGLLSDAFDNKAFRRKLLDKNIKKSLHVLKVTLDQLMLMIDQKVNSREELTDLFVAQHNLLRQLMSRKEYHFNYWMIQGTFQYLQTYIMSNTFMYEDLTKRNEFMNHCLFLFREHVDILYKKLIE
ncbi:MAG: hypothetical protein ACI9U0_000672 [Flavobacteriales bacterium]|jgi:hypothetical protein